MYTGNLHILGMVHDCKEIAGLYSWRYTAYKMKNPLKQGAMDRSFLLETVRHISRK
jgi:hypothetical protein